MFGGLILADNDDRWAVVCTRQRLFQQKIVCGKVAGTGIMVVQDGNEIFACERACPHEQADLSRGHVADGRLHCPHHRASFSLVTGDVSPGWDCRQLRRYPIRYDDIHIWIDAHAIDRESRG
jgi:3-phenylpropionate/trans-cinnamate dioxygenase ferredoxin component